MLYLIDNTVFDHARIKAMVLEFRKIRNDILYLRKKSAYGCSRDAIANNNVTNISSLTIASYY
jgi:hypothetical protein